MTIESNSERRQADARLERLEFEFRDLRQVQERRDTRIYDKLDAIQSDITALREKVAALKVTSGVIGSIAGAITAVGGWIGLGQLK